MKQNGKTDSRYDGLRTPTSFLPRAARGRMKEGELRPLERFAVNKVSAPLK